MCNTIHTERQASQRGEVCTQHLGGSKNHAGFEHNFPTLLMAIDSTHVTMSPYELDPVEIPRSVPFSHLFLGCIVLIVPLKYAH